MRSRELGIDVPAEHQLRAMFAEIREAVDDLEAGALVELEEHGVKVHRRTPSLIAFLGLAAAAVRDGYPTSSTREPGGAASRLDEDGHAIPPIADPTGELAAADSKIVDPIRNHASSVLRGLSSALGDLRLARGALIRGSKYAKVGPGEPGCKSHERLERWVPVDRGERCSWCYRFALVWRRDPPLEILRLHDVGRRITDAKIREAIREENRRPRARARR